MCSYSFSGIFVPIGISDKSTMYMNYINWTIKQGERYNPVFDSVLMKKVPQPALTADSGAFDIFAVARYAFGFLV